MSFWREARFFSKKLVSQGMSIESYFRTIFEVVGHWKKIGRFLIICEFVVLVTVCVCVCLCVNPFADGVI